MPTKRAVSKPAKAKKVEKPKLTAKKPAAKTVAAKAPAKPAPAKAPATAKPVAAAPAKPAPTAKPAPVAAKPAPAPAATSVAQAIRKSAPSDRIVVTATGVPSQTSSAASAARAAEADNDDEPGSLLAGPRNVTPYITKRGEAYMNNVQLDHFRNILNGWKRDLMQEVDRTVSHMKDEAANFPDPNDRATQEEEFSLELRTRDRERKLIRKIDEALKRVEDGSYGYCLETGEEIGVKRLEARPVATLTIEAQERRERRERQYGDRDDRYR
jgi:DnaK suppressor protein